MKICFKCQTNQPVDAYSWRNKARGIKLNVCKSCQRLYTKKHYLDNSKKYVERAKANRPKYRQQGKDFIVAYLLKNPCVDCGEADIEVLEFDHKELVGSQARRINSYVDSINALKAEIEKCEVRCANCHTRRTRRQLGWFRQA